MRLIDADNLILEINKLLESPYANHTEPYTGMQVRKEAIETVRDLCVKQEPTAFDIEKVVEQINGIEVVLPIDYISANNIGFVFKIVRLVKDGTIDIIRKGGIPAAVQEEGEAE